jgi:CheY-like chemotaxis protein
MKRPKLILVIDDDRDFLDFVAIVLRSRGYEVRTATTAAEGLRAMREAAPALVIADVMMSYVLDGWTISREMVEDPALAGIPIMMVSAIVTFEDDDLFPPSERARIDAFMSKPLDPAALLAHVDKLTSDCQGG